MSLGLGIDIVKVGRIESLVEKWGEKFLYRVFTEREIDYCLSRSRRFEHLAGRFAAKEALIKAMENKVAWTDIEILSTSEGSPRVELHIEEKREDLCSCDPKVSISHTEEYAVAEATLD